MLLDYFCFLMLKRRLTAHWPRIFLYSQCNGTKNLYKVQLVRLYRVTCPVLFYKAPWGHGPTKPHHFPPISQIAPPSPIQPFVAQPNHTQPHLPPAHRAPPKPHLAVLKLNTFKNNTFFRLQVYINYVNLLVNLFFPTLTLVLLNTLVYKALQKSISPGENQIRRNRGKSEDALRKRDIRLTRIAIIIVCIFVICHLPRFIPNVVEMFLSELPEVTS